jgi:hypothetical protein
MAGLNEPKRRNLLKLAVLGAVGTLEWPQAIFAQPNAVPDVLSANLVNYTRTSWNGRECLAVELTEQQQTRVNEQAQILACGPPRFSL